MQKEIRVKRKEIYRGRLVYLVVDDIRLGKKKAIRELIIHPGSAVVVPVIDAKKRKIILIRQFRYAANRVLIELPAGTREHGESTLTCAKREIVEEAGYSASRFKKLATLYPAPGALTEKMDIYMATGLRKAKQDLDYDEQIKPFVTTIDKAIKLILSGRIIDGKTIAGIMLADKVLR